MSAGKTLTNIFAGFAAGAVLGLLFAPEKGSETRKKISQKSTDVSDAIKDGFCDIVDAIKNKYENIKGDAEDIMEKGKEKFNHVKNTATSEYTM